MMGSSVCGYICVEAPSTCGERRPIASPPAEAGAAAEGEAPEGGVDEGIVAVG